MKKTIFLTLLILQASFLMGCRIEFSATSAVRENGDIERATIYRAESLSDKEQLAARYQLPANGKWVEDKKIQDGKEQIEYVYQANRRVSLKDQPASDYVCSNEAKTRFAKNSFEVRVKNLWFVKWYEYSERFHDAQDFEAGKNFLNGLYDAFTQAFKTSLSAQLPQESTAIVAEVEKYYKNILDKTSPVIFNPDPKERSSKAFLDTLGKELSVEEAKLALLKSFPEIEKNQSASTAIDLAFAQAKKTAETYWDDKNRQSSFLEAIGGVHGFQLFDTYPFKVVLSLPGKLLSSNGVYENGQVSWTFTADNLNRELQAKSRKFFPKRIGLTILLSLLILGLAFGALRRLKK